MRPIKEGGGALRFPKADFNYAVKIRLQFGEERQRKDWFNGTSGRFRTSIFQSTECPGIPTKYLPEKWELNSRHGPMNRDTSESFDLRKMVHREEMEVPSGILYQFHPPSQVDTHLHTHKKDSPSQPTPSSL